MTEILSFLCDNQLFTNHSQLLFSHSVIVFLLTLLLLFFSSALFQALRKGILGFQFYLLALFSFQDARDFFHSLLKFSSRFLYRCNSFIIPHFLKFVKRVFKTFFKVFPSLHLTKPLAVFDSLPLLSALVFVRSRFLYPLHYSSFNLRFFAILRGFLFPSRLTTILLYHTFDGLSTLFDVEEYRKNELVFVYFAM